jgi:HK97 family phage portal protein
MQAVAIQAEMDTTANRWNWNIFKNGGSVADILSTDQVMSDEQKERVANKRKSKFQGVNNAHRIAVLDSGLTYQKVAINQKELDFVESRRFTRDEILAIFKVPKAII